MLALCSMLSVTYYAQNYAGIIGWSLAAAASVARHIHWRPAAAGVAGAV